MAVTTQAKTGARKNIGSKTRSLKTGARGADVSRNQDWTLNRALSSFFGKSVYANQTGGIRVGRQVMSKSILTKAYQALGSILDFEGGKKASAH